jgi:type I restriction enzyme S subunit
VRSKMAQAGDTVVTTKGNSTGRTGYVGEDFPPFVYSPHLSYWRSQRPDQLVPAFLRYWARGPEFLEQLEGMKTSTDMAPYLSLTDQRRLRITLPTPSVQRDIASALTSLDDKIELNHQMNHTLEEMASVLFERLMVRVDDDAALETSVQSLIDRQLLVVGDGYRAKNEELASAGLPFARAGNIDAGFLFADTELLGWPAVMRAGIKISVPFDVVFTSKGTVGRFAFVSPMTPKFAYSPQLCFWRSVDHDVLSPFFLYHWMRSSRFLEQVDAVKGQTDMADYVSLTDQRSMRMSCPKAGEHRRLRDEVATFWDLHFANTDESKTLAALRDALLPKLLSGEVCLKQAENMVEAAL